MAKFSQEPRDADDPTIIELNTYDDETDENTGKESFICKRVMSPKAALNMRNISGDDDDDLDLGTLVDFWRELLVKESADRMEALIEVKNGVKPGMHEVNDAFRFAMADLGMPLPEDDDDDPSQPPSSGGGRAGTGASSKAAAPSPVSTSKRTTAKKVASASPSS